MKIKLPRPVNETQRLFAVLCEKGGGAKGGPPRGKVQELLRDSGLELNKLAEFEIAHALAMLPDADPWKVCFAVGIAWGHLARFGDEFIESAVAYLEDGKASDLSVARSHHNERGPLPVEQSLQGGRHLFSKVVLPGALPNTLAGMRQAQERWLSPILSKERPRYIGSWNATALFMVALFSQPPLGDEMKDAAVMLPPGGPIFSALSILHTVGLSALKPEGNELDDEAFQPGSIYANTGLMADFRKGRDDWDMLDVHSGLYMLGTRDPASATYFR